MVSPLCPYTLKHRVIQSIIIIVLLQNNYALDNRMYPTFLITIHDQDDWVYMYLHRDMFQNILMSSGQANKIAQTHTSLTQCCYHGYMDH